MKRNRNHWTTTDPNFVKEAIGGSEKKLKTGQWIKVSKNAVFRGPSRDSVRNQAKAF